MFYCLDEVFYDGQPTYDYFSARDPSQTRQRAILDTTVTNQAVSGLSYLAQIFNIPEAVETPPFSAIILVNDSPLEREIIEVSDSEENEHPDRELTETVEEKDSLEKEIATVLGDSEEHTKGPYCSICGDEKDISTATKGPQGGDLCVKHANAYNFTRAIKGNVVAQKKFADRFIKHPLTNETPVDLTEVSNEEEKQVIKTKKKRILRQHMCGICGIQNRKPYYRGPEGSYLCTRHGQSYRKWRQLAKEESLDLSIIQKVFAPRYTSPPNSPNLLEEKSSPNDILKAFFNK